jgi:hypothetical protein
MAQLQGGYLDLYIAKVKPEKRAEFDTINERIADANRRFKGDTWIAFEVTYGEQNTVMFSSVRESYDAAGKSSNTFDSALQAAFGEAGFHTLLQQFTSTLESSRAEIRKRRWDLSYNAPKDQAEYFQTLGKARWLRSSIVHVRPGHALEFEAAMKEISAAAQKSNQSGMRWVAQVTLGGNPGTYVISRLLTSFGELDQTPSLQEMLGEEGYQKLQTMDVNAVAGVEYLLYRIVPEISNPAAEVVRLAPDFWHAIAGANP